MVLLPNFGACVTREMRLVDGYDTVDLLEQVKPFDQQPWSKMIRPGTRGDGGRRRDVL